MATKVIVNLTVRIYKTEMKVLSWGANSHGQLGQGITSEQSETPNPVICTWRDDIFDIIGGGGHSLLINSENAIFGCGWNHHKQLAIKEEKTESFTRIWDMSGIKIHKVAAGWDSSAAVTNHQYIYTWGGNGYGQLGLPRNHFSDSVKPIKLELQVKSIQMGMRHTILADINGKVWATGCGKKGQLGMGEPTLDLDTFQKIPELENIDEVICGQHHTLAWSSENKILYCWGNNLFGQLGFDKSTPRVFVPTRVPLPQDILDNVKSIHSGWTHSAVLLNDGTAVYWGRGDYGQRALKQLPEEKFYNLVKIEDEKIVQLSLGSEHSVCLTEKGSVWSWGWNEHGNTGTGRQDENSSLENVFDPQQVKMPDEKVIKVVAGTGHNFAILS